MATLKQRLHRKNGSAYDIIHMETESNVVLRPSGNTVETDLTNYLPKVQNSDDVPEGLTPGQISIGQSKVYFCGVDGETYELTAKSSTWFPVYGDSFTYTGDYLVIDEGNGDWRVKFLTSGTFTAVSDLLIDVFAVGGGGGGGFNSSNKVGSGGGGGYTKTVNSLVLNANTEYPIIIGDGGATVSNGSGSDGGDTSAFSVIANGGKGGANSTSGGGSALFGKAGDGGSGGAGTSTKTPYYGNGGSDGSNGGGNTNSCGTGQGTTTREFEEPTGDLYAGGGGSFYNNNIIGLGGDGGGGNGKINGTTNSGGGGGGHANGGSGIVIIRNHRE